jgi:hypothetical protein
VFGPVFKHLESNRFRANRTLEAEGSIPFSSIEIAAENIPLD